MSFYKKIILLTYSTIKLPKNYWSFLYTILRILGKIVPRKKKEKEAREGEIKTFESFVFLNNYDNK